MKSETIETPHLTHFTRKDYEDFYEPREDSFFLMDTLESDLETIRHLSPTFIAEVGSGSGIIITALASTLTDLQCIYFATDINDNATLATKKTADSKNTPIEICTTHLLDSFRSELFDLIIFNPPYVPCDFNQVRNSNLEKAWSGGVCHGRDIIDKFLEKLPSYLTRSGICYLLVLKENNVADILRFGTQTLGLQSEVVNERKILGEHLFVIKFQKL